MNRRTALTAMAAGTATVASTAMIPVPVNGRDVWTEAWLSRDIHAGQSYATEMQMFFARRNDGMAMTLTWVAERDVKEERKHKAIRTALKVMSTAQPGSLDNVSLFKLQLNNKQYLESFKFNRVKSTMADWTRYEL